MKKYQQVFSLVLITCSGQIWAGEVNDCGRLHIQVGNVTKKICQLISTDVIHGSLITPPPIAIPPGDSKRFDMYQSGLHGPHITLTYSCEDDIIAITSQQNYCFLEAGDIYGIIRQPLPPNISVDYIKETGSYASDTPGMISWIFSESHELR